MPDDRYMASYLLFAVKNIISRGYGGCSTIFGVSRGEGGVTASSLKWKIRRGGGVLYDIPSVVGVWIFSGTTQYLYPVLLIEGIKDQI